MDGVGRQCGAHMTSPRACFLLGKQKEVGDFFVEGAGQRIVLPTTGGYNGGGMDENDKGYDVSGLTRRLRTLRRKGQTKEAGALEATATASKQ